jgi:anion transporter
MKATAGAPAGAIPVAEPTSRALHVKLAKCAACALIPLGIWFAPLAIASNIKAAFAISGFMILAWMTELMEYASAGLFGLLLFWFFGIAKPDVIFSGFVNDASWFYLGAMLIGAMATKSGLPQRIGNVVITRVGATYSRLLLGLIIIDFLLTFVVPSGAAVLVIMASITIGVMKLFDAERGSNIGRGLFVVITYTTTIFNKMIIAGTAAIMSRSIIEQAGGVTVSWGMWFAAFLPTSIVTIFAAWWFTLKLFPPEAASIEGRADRVKAHFSTTTAWTPLSIKAAVLSALALLLWMTDWLHGVSASVVAFAAGLFGLLPFVEVLDEKDFKRINLLPFFFVAAALGMGEVLKVTGGLKMLTDAVIGGLEPLLTGKAVALTALYWGGFFYHFATASEVSMLVTSLPVLMNFARSHSLDAAWVGMIWSFSSGGKLFAYQSAVLVLGYGYGYFRPMDLIKLGALLTVVDFVVLALSVAFYWPVLGV